MLFEVSICVCTDCSVKLVYLPCCSSYGTHVDFTRQAVDEVDVSALVCFAFSMSKSRNTLLNLGWDLLSIEGSISVPEWMTIPFYGLMLVLSNVMQLVLL